MPPKTNQNKIYPLCYYCGFPVQSGKAQRIYIKGSRVAHSNINICIQVMQNEIDKQKGIITQLQDEVNALAESLRLFLENKKE